MLELRSLYWPFVSLSQMVQFPARQDGQLLHNYVRLPVLIRVQTAFYTMITSASKGNWRNMIVKVPKQMKEINNTAKPMKRSDLKQEKASITQAGILAFHDLNK